MNIQTITNVGDCVPLYLPHSLYLKPLAKINVSVSMPTNWGKKGKSISNYDIMEKLTLAIKPDNFVMLKVSKTTTEFIRFEAELEDRTKLKNILSRLDGCHLKLSGFSDSRDPFKVRASEAKDDFPTRHDWDSFFRDARNMDEMKAGERPDTVHLSNLPIKWFCPRHMENDGNAKPSENILKRIFEKFGSVRHVDIPICDPYRTQMKIEITGMKTFKFDQEVMFEGYVQFSEYVGFVKAMDEFRGMKLIRKLGDKNQAVNLVVTFDKTKHLSDASLKRRNIVRDRLIAKERTRVEDETRKRKVDEERLERERKNQDELKLKELECQRDREEKRKQRHLKKLHEKGQLEIDNKIRLEEKKLLIAQRKLESIRVLEAIFERVKTKQLQTETEIKKENNKNTQHNNKLEKNDLRNKLANKYKTAQELLLEKQKSKLEEVKGKSGLRALIENERHKNRSPSVNTISSGDSVLSDTHRDSKTKNLKKKKKRKTEDSSELSSTDDDEKAIEKSKLPIAVTNPFASLYNTQIAAEWMQQMGFYPYGTPFFPGLVRPPGLYPNADAYRGGLYGNYRGRFPRGRGRGGRGRGGVAQYSEASGNYKYDYNDGHDRRRSRSYSRSRSRSRSRHRSKYSRSRRSRTCSRVRTRSRTRSRNRSKGHHNRSRSKSRSHSHHSRKRSRSRSRSLSKSKAKLVSTRRSKSMSSGWSNSRSRSRSWSNTHRVQNENRDSKPTGVVLQSEKQVRSAKEIQRSVQQTLHNRLREEEEKNRQTTTKLLTRQEAAETAGNAGSSSSTVACKRRSGSVDSAKFISPKRKEKSGTPERDWTYTRRNENRKNNDNYDIEIDRQL